MPLLLKAFSPEILLSLAILYQIVFYHSRMVGNIRANYPVISKEMYVHVLFVLFLLLSALLMNKHEYNVYGALLVSNSSLTTMKVLVVITAICICPAMFKAFELENFCHPEYFTLFLIVIFSLLLMISANDLLVFFLIMEMQTISFYILVSFKRDSVFSSEAGLKYVISGSFISGIYLFGCMLLYLTLGTGNLDCITSILTCKESFHFLVLIGVILITVTLLFKLSCAPFHAWMVDVYDGAPSSTTVILATLPKIAFTFFFNEMVELYWTLFQLYSNAIIIFWNTFYFNWNFFCYNPNKIKTNS
jgi:NADH-quinone oxidoreductase subunit N